MSNEIDNDTTDSDSLGSTILATATDAVTNLATGVTIPPPIRKNMFKAFDRLCTAVIDIPVSYLEGKTAEKRAETESRIKLISTGADQIAAQMNVDPEYAQVAVKKFGQKIVREQINIDKTCEVAVNQILHDTTASKVELTDATEAASINDDWLNNFEKEASLKSTEEMQLLFGRILAGEIKQPSSFSIKTVKLLARLDEQAAALFQQLCSACISLRLNNEILDARVLSLGGNAGANSLKDYGLNFDQLNLLNEYGLIISDYNSYFNYQLCIANEAQQVGLSFAYQNQEWGFLPVNNRPRDQELRLHGVALSRSGKELINIVDIEPNEKYSSALQEYFKGLNLQMAEIKRQ